MNNVAYFFLKVKTSSFLLYNRTIVFLSSFFFFFFNKISLTKLSSSKHKPKYIKRKGKMRNLEAVKEKYIGRLGLLEYVIYQLIMWQNLVHEIHVQQLKDKTSHMKDPISLYNLQEGIGAPDAFTCRSWMDSFVPFVTSSVFQKLGLNKKRNNTKYKL